MTDISEEDIRARAYALWEADGHQDGTHDAHWLEALRQLTEEANATQEDSAVQIPSSASKLSVVNNDTQVDSTIKKRGKVI